MTQRQDSAIKCREEGCEKPARARGLCKSHYNRWYREQDVEHHKARSLEWYYENRERLSADPEFHRRRHQAEQTWVAKNPERAYEHHRRHIAKGHGLTLEEYDEILARGCAICGTHEGRMCLDHDHVEGKVRDALCHKCNAGLGMMKDDPARLRAAADYIESHR